MDEPDDHRGRTPRDRFRNILSADKDEGISPETRKPAVVNLPQAGPTAGDDSMGPESTIRVSEPGRAGTSASKWSPTFWTAGAILSILANLILLVVLINTWRGINAFGRGGANASTLLSAYASLDQLEQAHLRAIIPVQTSITLDATLPVTSSTKITLAHDVPMQGAHVTIDTALFNIDAPANITLPAGTSLDVALDMSLPLQASVPISMDVPVDIAVRDTELRAAIQGMKDALKPLLCTASPGARLPDGSAICR